MFETRKPAVLRTYFKYFEVAFWASTFELAVYLSAFSPPFSPITASVLLVKPTQTMNGIINILGRDVIYIIREKESLQDLIFLLTSLYERGKFIIFF